MNDPQKAFLQKACAEAIKAGHPFARMAACEAALESNYGNSVLAADGNNLFGMKQHCHAVYGTMSLPTREFLNTAWVTVSANWVRYPDWASCFADRLATLQRLANAFPHYSAALHATDPITYVQQVSQTWSTDPQRAAKVISIFNDWGNTPNVATT